MRSVVSMPASEVIHSTGRRASGRSAVVTRANGIRTSGQHVVNIKSTWKKRYKIVNADAIPVYNANAQDYLQNLDLPLGAQLVAVDTNTGAWQMQVPKLEFSDVFIKYVATRNIMHASTQHVLVWHVPSSGAPSWRVQANCRHQCCNKHRVSDRHNQTGIR